MSNLNEAIQVENASETAARTNEGSLNKKQKENGNINEAEKTPGISASTSKASLHGGRKGNPKRNNPSGTTAPTEKTSYQGSKIEKRNLNIIINEAAKTPGTLAPTSKTSLHGKPKRNNASRTTALTEKTSSQGCEIGQRNLNIIINEAPYAPGTSVSTRKTSSHVGPKNGKLKRNKASQTKASTEQNNLPSSGNESNSGDEQLNKGEAEVKKKSQNDSAQAESSGTSLNGKPKRGKQKEEKPKRNKAPGRTASTKNNDSTSSGFENNSENEQLNNGEAEGKEKNEISDSAQAESSGTSLDGAENDQKTNETLNDEGSPNATEHELLENKETEVENALVPAETTSDASLNEKETDASSNLSESYSGHSLSNTSKTEENGKKKDNTFLKLGKLINLFLWNEKYFLIFVGSYKKIFDGR